MIAGTTGCDLLVYDSQPAAAASTDPAERADAAKRLSAELALLVPTPPARC